MGSPGIAVAVGWSLEPANAAFGHAEIDVGPGRGRRDLNDVAELMGNPQARSAGGTNCADE